MSTPVGSAGSTGGSTSQTTPAEGAAIMAPEKMGTNFDTEILKSPLTVGRPKGEVGPDVHNSPVMKPADPLKLVPENSRTVRGGSKKG